MAERDPFPAMTKVQDPGLDLKALTAARVGLGRFGAGLPTKAQLAFRMDHARAREAVWSLVDRSSLAARLQLVGLHTVEVESLADDRSIYVRRPDLGRRISALSQDRLLAIRSNARAAFDVAVVVADGLSSSAVELNAAPLVEALAVRFRAMSLALAPVVLAANARVALADPVGEALGAAVSVMLIGERPGLSAADGLGAYVTYGPTPGTPDSRRNCISNIRDGGLQIGPAADAVARLVNEMLRARMSGVALNDALGGLLALTAE